MSYVTYADLEMLFTIAMGLVLLVAAGLTVIDILKGRK